MTEIENCLPRSPSRGSAIMSISFGRNRMAREVLNRDHIDQNHGVQPWFNYRNSYN